MSAILSEVPAADLEYRGCVVQGNRIGQAFAHVPIRSRFVDEDHFAGFVVESGFDVRFFRSINFGNATIEDASFLGMEEGLSLEENRKKRFG